MQSCEGATCDATSGVQAGREASSVASPASSGAPSDEASPLLVASIPPSTGEAWVPPVEQPSASTLAAQPTFHARILREYT
jgi:hypothetical protein